MTTVPPAEGTARVAPAVEHATETLRAGVRAADGPVALACSFSLEDVVALDLLRQVAPEAGVFALDTGRLPEATYEVAETVRQRFETPIQWFFPDTGAVEALEREQGLFSFRDSVAARRHCCHIRKVEPLGRALEGLAGWVTGLRQGQSPTRAALDGVEVDPGHGGIVKINPLAKWSWEDVEAYAAQRRLPVHRLHTEGYPSIGCAPCTRAVVEGESLRGGRWWWEDPEHKECGLHGSRP